ncbi:unnamed protein product, partial [Hapterophycus canaliculatus]
GSDDSGEIDEALLEGLDISGAGAGGGVPGEDEEERAVLDTQFESTLAEYDSDEWGELDEDDNRVQGRWDIEKHNYANTCLDEFLASKEDARWTEGVERLRPELRGIATATLAVDRAATAAAEVAAAVGAATGRKGESPASAGGVAARGDVSEPRMGEGAGEGAAPTKSATTGPRLGNLRGLGGLREEDDKERGAEEEEEEEEEEEDELHDMEHHNEYLRDKPADQWDCETIVSTYTNLDNHPSVLGTGRKPKPSRPRRAPVAAAGSEGDAGNASPVQQVTLSEKTGLPVGVLPERTFNDAGMVSLTAGKNMGEKRDAEETVEEKRRRKAEIKQSRRDKRAQKKSVKVAFTGEAKVISHALANPEAPQNRSVFSYS